MQHRRDRRKRRHRRSSPWPGIVWTVVILLAVAGVSYGVWRFARPAAEPTGTSTPAAPAEPETASQTKAMPEEGGASQPDAETTTAPVENSAPPQHMAQEPINQLIETVCRFFLQKAAFCGFPHTVAR